MAASIREPKFLLAFGSWWLIWTAMHIVVLIDAGVSKNIAVTDSVVSNIFLALSCLLISNSMRYYLPRQEKYWYTLAVSFALSLLWLLLVRLSLWAIFKTEFTYLQLLSASSSLRYAEAFLINGCMVVINLLVYTQKDREETGARKAETEQLNKEAELYKLRQQFQPHFLFNSLNSISALTGSKPEQARHMIEQLSGFLRGTLTKDDMPWTTLGEELKYLGMYLEIEKVRFGYRLQTVIECDDAALSLVLPSMLLQPLVENAIKFGLYDTIGDVIIHIIAKVNVNDLEISVRNPFDEETAVPKQGTGFGLSSIKRRLYLLFARHDLLQTIAAGGDFLTTVTIPQSVASQGRISSAAL